MGASASSIDDTLQEKLLEKNSQELLANFQNAIMKAAGVTPPSGGMGTCTSAGCDSSARLKDIFDQADENHDGVLDQHEMENLIEKLNFDLSENLKKEMQANMKSLLLAIADDSFRIFFDQFLSTVGNGGGPSCRSPMISREKKRVVFVGATGAGKSSLCTVLTGQSEDTSTFVVGNSATSQTLDCSLGNFHWFGDNNNEEFIVMDTPGLDDECNRDVEHINSIIESMRKLEYVNNIVLVLNGENRRFSTSLQRMIKMFETSFGKAFYEHSIICLTRWSLEKRKLKERNKKGITEEGVAKELNEKICGSKSLMCRSHLNVVFVDCGFDPEDEEEVAVYKPRFEKLKNLVSDKVFRTADLTKVKAKIVDVSNPDQQVRTGAKIVHMYPRLFDSAVEVQKWVVEPVPPEGLIVDEKKGIITGIPLKVTQTTDYRLFAITRGGKSEGFPFRLEVGHSESEITGIVLTHKKFVVDELDAMLPLEGGEIPKDKDECTRMEHAATERAEQLKQERITLLEEECGSFFTYSEIKDKFVTEVNMTLMTLKYEFMEVHQANLVKMYDRERAEKELELQLVREVVHVDAFKTVLEAAEKVDAREELLKEGREWLLGISPCKCIHAPHGCPTVMMKKELQSHEEVCLFGLPLHDKTCLLAEKSKSSAVAVILSNIGGTDKSWDGKYTWDNDDKEYYVVNRNKMRLQKLTRDAQVDKNGKSKWLLQVQTQQNGPCTTEFTSSNEVDDILDAKIGDFKIEPDESYAWKKDAELKHPHTSSVKLIYFGGKWCPYCPPFTKKLAQFFTSVRKQMGNEAVDVIFVSSDRDEAAMFEYYMEDHGDWFAIPYSNRELKNNLSSKFNVTGIPSCFLLTNKMESVDSVGDLRGIMKALPDTSGTKQDVEAKRIYEKLKSAVQASEGAESEVGKAQVDMFFSLRFGEAMREAQLVQAALKEKGYNAVIVNTTQGGDIANDVADQLFRAKLVVIFGTATYGRGTVSYSTKEELQFVFDEKKPIFLIKMCDKFEEPRTRLMLSNAVMYTPWDVNKNPELDPKLVDAIEEKFKEVLKD